jgi:hypothetical protein
MSHYFKCEISETLEQLLKSQTDYNVVIYVGRENKEFHAHSSILQCRSKILNEILLSSEDIEKMDGKYIVRRPNIFSPCF